MAKGASFSCSNCGAIHSKWSGRCDDCGAWNSISEDSPLSTGPSAKGLGATRGNAIALSDLASDDKPPPRATSGIT
ncbi:MAG: DNA repair protein RadA, partial [Boseongicola sp.]